MEIVINAYVHNLNEKNQRMGELMAHWEFSFEQYYYSNEPYERLKELLGKTQPGVLVETSRPLMVKIEGDKAPEDDVSFFTWRDGPCGLRFLQQVSDLGTSAWILSLLVDAQWRDAEYPPLKAIENWIVGHPLASWIAPGPEMTHEEHVYNVLATILNDSTKRESFLEQPYDGRRFNLGLLISCAAPRVLPSAFARMETSRT